MNAIKLVSGVGGWLVKTFLPRGQASSKQTQRARAEAGSSVVQAGRDINLNVQATPRRSSGITTNELATLDSMPKLVAELQRGLLHPEGEFIREFVVIPNRRVIFNSEKPRIALYLEEFGDVNLIGQLDALEANGFVEDISIGDRVCQIYRMTQKFISHLRSSSKAE